MSFAKTKIYKTIKLILIAKTRNTCPNVTGVPGGPQLKPTTSSVTPIFVTAIKPHTNRKPASKIPAGFQIGCMKCAILEESISGNKKNNPIWIERTEPQINQGKNLEYNASPRY